MHVLDQEHQYLLIDTEDYLKKDSKKLKPIRRTTVGFLVADREDAIVMCTDIYEKDSKHINAPMVIPKGAVFVKKFYKHISYIEAEDINEYSEGIIKIINNYSKFLEISKKQSAEYKKEMHQDYLNNRI